MLLSLEDERVRIRLTRVTNNRLRLVMDFPREDDYRDRVLAALGDFISGPSDNRAGQDQPATSAGGSEQ